MSVIAGGEEYRRQGVESMRLGGERGHAVFSAAAAGLAGTDRQNHIGRVNRLDGISA